MATSDPIEAPRTPVMVCVGNNWVRCHVCPAIFSPPKLKDGYHDIGGSCPGCGKKYIFWWKDLP